ncbi:MAG TPA: hypothetical protein VK886_10425 [Vicinamibacterales bacterium]|nr:hypothetical protein [Vicinamibacterales bacterium]
MKLARSVTVAALLALGMAWIPAAGVNADVKTQEKGHVKFEGMLGRMMNLFGGKAAKEGVVSNVAVSGDRKATMSDNGGQIIDLGEEKVYDVDLKKKTYKVTTFEEIRRQIREAQERAEKEAREAEGKEETAEKGKEVEIDFDVKETGQKKSIAGYDTRQVITTITVREKGRTLEEGGGLVLTSDAWMAPRIPAMKEIADFDVRYAKAIDVTGAAGASAEQLATALAMYPGLQKALARMQAEGSQLDGTPLESVLTVEGVKSAEQMSQAKEEQSGGGGGLGGMLARRVRKKPETTGAKSTIMTVTHNVLSVSSSVAPGDLEIPAGFKERS